MTTIQVTDLNPINGKNDFDLSLLKQLSEEEVKMINGGELWGWEANGGGAIREMNTNSSQSNSCLLASAIGGLRGYLGCRLFYN